MAKRKKYQFGEVNPPQAKMQEFSGNIPNKDILHFLLTQQGQNLINQYKNNGYSIKANDSQVTASRPTGEYKLPESVQAFNAAAITATGLANRVNDIKAGQDEYRQYIEALQPIESENFNEEGLNNLPTYTKYGGGCEYGCGDVDHAFINEMMKSGGWIQGAIKHPGRCSNPGDSRCPKGSPQYNLAMRFKHGDLHKHQIGGNTVPRMTPQQMEQFNRFNNYVKDQGYSQSDKLNNQQFSKNLYSQFLQSNPDVALPYEQMIPMAQQEQYYLKSGAQDFASRHNDPNAQNLMSNITPFDSMYGPKTSTYNFPTATLNTLNNGQLVNQKNLGLVTGTGTGLQATGASAKNYSIPKGVKLETFYDSTGKAESQGYEDPHTGDLVIVSKMPYGGGPLTAEGAKEILRDGTIHGKPLTEKQRKYFGYIAGGGKPHQFGGGDVPSVEAEKGEAYQTPQGQVMQIPNSAPTHEQGGVVLNNAERVLENTSNIRKDKKSQKLLLSPQLASLLTGEEIKSSVSHAGAMEKAQEGINNQRKKLNNKIKKNVNEIEDNPQNFYANNSLDFNLLNLKGVANAGDIFNNLFQHQEMIKQMHGIHNPTAQYGIDNASRLHNTEGWQFLYKKGDKSYYRKGDGTVVATNGPKMSDADWKQFLANESPAHKAERLARQQSYQYGYTVDPGIISDIQHPEAKMADLSRNFQFPNVNIPDDTTITNTAPGSRLKINGNPKSQFNEPLHWYDVAGPLMGLAGDNRIPVRYNPADFNQVRLKLQNPLPALQEGQRDYNNALGNLPQNSQGYANVANLFARKYGIDNQILGQYENANTQIKNQETLYNAGVKDRQSLSDQQARAVFEDQRLGSIEAQRLQRRTDWDSLFQTIAQNRALNRNGNLVMQLFPAFDQNAQYNGYQVPFRRPLDFPNQIGNNGLPANTDIITSTTNAGKQQYFLKNPDGTLKEIKFKN